LGLHATPLQSALVQSSYVQRKLKETIQPLSTPPNSIPGTHRFAHEAMGTTFEICIADSDAGYAEQAAWAAFDELDRLEQELSRHVENSDISRINNLAANQPLQIGLAAFECLQLCVRISAETNGAFDATIGSLLDCWLRGNGTRRSPSKEDVNLARQRTGLHLMELDEAGHTVQLQMSPVQIDLGGIGKGYAVDRMAALLRDWSIDAALIHGGYSSVLAIGEPQGTKGWPVTLSYPGNHRRTIAHFDLQNRAISGSGLQKGQHIIDPRSGQPVKSKRAAWSLAPTAAIADALSTALMVMTPDEVRQYCLSHPDTLAMIVTEVGNTDTQEGGILRYGPWNGHLLRER